MLTQIALVTGISIPMYCVMFLCMYIVLLTVFIFDYMRWQRKPCSNCQAMHDYIKRTIKPCDSMHNAQLTYKR